MNDSFQKYRQCRLKYRLTREKYKLKLEIPKPKQVTFGTKNQAAIVQKHGMPYSTT